MLVVHPLGWFVCWLIVVGLWILLLVFYEFVGFVVFCF